MTIYLTLTINFSWLILENNSLVNKFYQFIQQLIILPVNSLANEFYT